MSAIELVLKQPWVKPFDAERFERHRRLTAARQATAPRTGPFRAGQPSFPDQPAVGKA